MAQLDVVAFVGERGLVLVRSMSGVPSTVDVVVDGHKCSIGGLRRTRCSDMQVQNDPRREHRVENALDSATGRNKHRGDTGSYVTTTYKSCHSLREEELEDNLNRLIG